MFKVDEQTVEGLNSQKILALPPTVQATANATETLTVASPTQWIFTGTVAGQIVKLPDATTLIAGWIFRIWNVSTKNIAVQDAATAALCTIYPNTRIEIVLQAAGSAAGTWVKFVNYVGSGEPGNDCNINVQNAKDRTDYWVINSTTYQVFSNWIYRGTGVWSPTAFKGVCSRNGTTGVCSMRVYDVTNALEICTFTWGAVAKAIYSTTTISNLPSGEAIFELQCKNPSGGSTGYVHAAGLYR